MSTSNEAVLTKMRFFHRWDHRHPIHRNGVKIANKTLRLLPLKLKYAAMGKRKLTEVPYNLVRNGDVVVQVGAPFDTLHSGRSRGFHLALAAGVDGKSFVVEPHPVSVGEYQKAARLFGLEMTAIEAAVAPSAGTVELLFDPDHPATNFVDGVANYSEDEKARFLRRTSRSDLLDNLVDSDESVKVLSITTNGAEFIALEGAANLLSRTEYVALAGPDRGAYDETLAALGFEFLSFDDRGVTYKRV